MKHADRTAPVNRRAPCRHGPRPNGRAPPRPTPTMSNGESSDCGRPGRGRPCSGHRTTRLESSGSRYLDAALRRFRLGPKPDARSDLEIGRTNPQKPADPPHTWRRRARPCTPCRCTSTPSALRDPRSNPRPRNSERASSSSRARCLASPSGRLVQTEATSKLSRIVNGDETDWRGPRLGAEPAVLHITLATR
jgi:hypothetical protein